jgi:hypothetical protein
MLGYGLNDGVGVGIAFAMKSEALRGQLWFGSILGGPDPDPAIILSALI